MLKKGLALGTLATVISANALAISYPTFTVNPRTNIVTANGLEWLQWDETIGESPDTVVTKYSSDGWGLASLRQMADLYNAFDFGIRFSATETSYQTALFGSHRPFTEMSEADPFIAMFGYTYNIVRGPYDLEDYEVPATGSLAIFADSLLSDGGGYGVAEVRDVIYDPHFGSLSGSAILAPYLINRPEHFTNHALALVRDPNWNDVTPVPLPAAAWLFLSGLGGYSMISRKRKFRRETIS